MDIGVEAGVGQKHTFLKGRKAGLFIKIGQFP
jgi:hypothetical protein